MFRPHGAGLGARLVRRQWFDWLTTVLSVSKGSRGPVRRAGLPPSPPPVVDGLRRASPKRGARRRAARQVSNSPLAATRSAPGSPAPVVSRLPTGPEARATIPVGGADQHSRWFIVAARAIRGQLRRLAKAREGPSCRMTTVAGPASVRPARTWRPTAETPVLTRLVAAGSAQQTPNSTLAPTRPAPGSPAPAARSAQPATSRRRGCASRQAGRSACSAAPRGRPTAGCSRP